MFKNSDKNKKWMLNSLEYVKDKSEVLRCAIHGVLLIDNAFIQGFIGLTDNTLVIALPGLTEKTIKTKANIALTEVESVSTKNTMLTHHLIISLKLKNGKIYRIRAAKKVYGIPDQAEQLTMFSERLMSLNFKNIVS